MTESICIGIDWGISNLRAALIGLKGEVLDTRSFARGILTIEKGAFAFELDAVCQDWREAKQDIQVLMIGMIGSQQGWVEAPYLSTPCNLNDLMEAMVTIPGTDGSVHIMPGIKTRTKDGAPEIMRGEETQIGGVIEGHGIRNGLFCIPGTHSKWAHICNGQIENFVTFMTGETFSVLKQHSILGRLMGPSDAFDKKAFENGLARSKHPGGLLHHLFSARTFGILDEIKTTSLSSFLSGQLIAEELRGVKELYGKLDHVHLLSSGNLRRSYSEAFTTAQIKTTHWDPEQAAWTGLWVAAESLAKN